MKTFVFQIFVVASSGLVMLDVEKILISQIQNKIQLAVEKVNRPRTARMWTNVRSLGASGTPPMIRPRHLDCLLAAPD